MVGSGLLDGDENWVSDDELFEKMFNFFDIPMESLEGIGLDGGDCDGKFKRFQSVSPDPLQGDLALVSGADIGSGSGSGVLDFLSSVPSDETSGPKQLLSFDEETSRAYIPVQNNSSHGSHSGMFQVPSPGSALESNSSCSVGKTIAVSAKIFIPVRTRSKRSRPSAFKQQRVMPPISPASSKSYRSISSGAFSQFVDLSESHFPNTISNPVKRKLGKKKKLSQLSSAHEMKENSTISELPIAKATMQTCFQRLVGPKKCTHCEITKTPQWREGPMGPKTLCNACGVRYRSGRLFPEYRPASSPTFVPSLHSNSHKKVIEMRNRASQEAGIARSESSSVATGE